MPRRRRVWSSWNYLGEAARDRTAGLRHLLDEPAAEPDPTHCRSSSRSTRPRAPRPGADPSRASLRASALRPRRDRGAGAAVGAAGRRRHLVLRRLFRRRLPRGRAAGGLGGRRAAGRRARGPGRWPTNRAHRLSPPRYSTWRRPGSRRRHERAPPSIVGRSCTGACARARTACDYRVFSLLLDLDELPELATAAAALLAQPASTSSASATRDHGAGGRRPAARRTSTRPAGAGRARRRRRRRSGCCAMPRILGYVFNPLERLLLPPHRRRRCGRSSTRSTTPSASATAM